MSVKAKEDSPRHPYDLNFSITPERRGGEAVLLLTWNTKTDDGVHERYRLRIDDAMREELGKQKRYQEVLAGRAEKWQQERAKEVERLTGGKLKYGMSPADVEAVRGKPTRTERPLVADATSDATIWIYPDAKLHFTGGALQGVEVVGGMPPAQEPATPLPPGRGPARAVVNSQKSLAEVVGDGFRDEAWIDPAGLLPGEFPGLTFVGGPADVGLAPKAAWRKPVVLRDEAAGVEVAVNCYRARPRPVPGAGPGTPFAPLMEPDYGYAKAEFHGLRAGAAAAGGRDVIAFRDGDLLFKAEASGGTPEARRKSAGAAVEAVWKFRQPR